MRDHITLKVKDRLAVTKVLIWLMVLDSPLLCFFLSFLFIFLFLNLSFRCILVGSVMGICRTCMPRSQVSCLNRAPPARNNSTSSSEHEP